jgi:hypothetical protein
MKIQLDTTAKTIKVEESVNLGSLTETLERLLPNGAWKEFKLEANVQINWANPIIIDRYYPPYHYWQPWYTTNGMDLTVQCDGGGSFQPNLQNGVYNCHVLN